MAATIQNVYNKKLKKHKKVGDVHNIKKNMPLIYERDYRTELNCENYKVCSAGMVFAVRKGTGYFRTHQNDNHSKNCAYDKILRKSANEKHNKRNVIKNDTKIPRDIGGPKEAINIKVSEREIRKSFDRIKAKLEEKIDSGNIGTTSTYKNPINTGVKKEGRFTNTTIEITKNGNIKNNVLRLRQLHAASIRDVHIEKLRFVYGKVSDVKSLKDNRISIVLENKFRIILRKNDIEQLKKRNNDFLEVIMTLKDKTLLLSITIYRTKPEYIKSLGNKYYGYPITGLEKLIWYK